MTINPGAAEHPHRQIAASILGSRADRIAIVNADTDLTPYDTGTFASTGTVVARPWARYLLPGELVREQLRRTASGAR